MDRSPAWHSASDTAGDGRAGRFEFDRADPAILDDNRNMAEFRCQAITPQEQPAITDQASANACADGDVGQVSAALGSALGCFGQGGNVGVIADKNRLIEFRLDDVFEGDVEPAGQIGRRDDDPAEGIQGSGRRDADAQNIVAGRRHDLADVGFHAVNGPLYALIGMRQGVFTLKQVEVLVIAGGANLRPAQINSDDLFSQARRSLIKGPAKRIGAAVCDPVAEGGAPLRLGRQLVGNN